jgi:mevalonate kinase
LVLANTVKRLDAGDPNGCAIKVLEAEHGPGSGLDPAMVLLDQVIQVSRGTQIPEYEVEWSFVVLKSRNSPSRLYSNRFFRTFGAG